MPVPSSNLDPGPMRTPRPAEWNASLNLCTQNTPSVRATRRLLWDRLNASGIRSKKVATNSNAIVMARILQAHCIACASRFENKEPFGVAKLVARHSFC